MNAAKKEKIIARTKDVIKTIAKLIHKMDLENMDEVLEEFATEHYALLIVEDAMQHEGLLCEGLIKLIGVKGGDNNVNYTNATKWELPEIGPAVVCKAMSFSEKHSLNTKNEVEDPNQLQLPIETPEEPGDDGGEEPRKKSRKKT